jgi:DNA polymerase-3 subunit beta
MKLKIKKSALLDGLQIVQNVVNLRSTLPILSNVLMVAEKTKLKLATTDLDMTVRCGIDVEVAKAGATTLPAKRLLGIVRELPDADIHLETDEKNFATLECESSFFKIMGLSEDEFPPIPKPDGKACYTLDQGVFREMLRKTAYAASADETRPVLNGVLMSFKGGKLTTVATDGRRLALAENEVEFPKESEADLVLPTKAVNELLHVLKDQGEMKIHAKENQVIFEFGEVLFASKLVEGTYPNYRQVIPGQYSERVTIEREGLLTALRRGALVTTDKSNATRLTFGKNKLVVVTSSPDVGESRETLPIKYAGKETTLAFNPEFLMDPLKTLANDEIFLEFSDELSPGVVKVNIPFLYVLMPMRIS